MKLSTAASVISSSLFLGLIICSSTHQALAETILGRGIEILESSNGDCNVNDALVASNLASRDAETLVCGGNLIVDSDISLGSGPDNIATIGYFHLRLGAKVDMGKGADSVRSDDGIVINGEMNLGDGNNILVAESTVTDGCKLDGGSILAGKGNDFISFSSSSTDGLYLHPGTLDLGDGQNTLNVAGSVTFTYDSKILGGKGVDTLNFSGGRLSISRNSMIDLGDGNDLINVSSHIRMDDDASKIILGGGDDTIKVDGCIRGTGTVDMGVGDDKIFAFAAHGTIEGGDGFDCYHPDAEDYTLECKQGILTLTAPERSCSGVFAPSVILDSVERIGCGDTGFHDIRSCTVAFDYTETFVFPYVSAAPSSSPSESFAPTS